MTLQTTNPLLQNLVVELLKKAQAEERPLWRRVAHDLVKSGKNKRIVNLARINRHTKQDETIVVPGKVLGDGVLDHAVTIAAFSFSAQALDKITEAKAKAITIEELMKEDVSGKRVRIIG
tara:strand:- start:3896 stop:4255 length:360 start_codon:yes stop_codon:yes gene_type:complete